MVHFNTQYQLVVIGVAVQDFEVLYKTYAS